MKRLLASKARPLWALLASVVVLLPLVVFPDTLLSFYVARKL